MDFFDRPDELTRGVGYRGEPASFGELFSAVEEKTRRVEADSALWRDLESEIDAHNDRLTKAGVTGLYNPLRRRPTSEEQQKIIADVLNPYGAGEMSAQQLGKNPYLGKVKADDYAAAYFMRQYEGLLKNLESEKPDLASVIQASKPPFLAVAERMKAAEKRLDQATESRDQAYSWLNLYRVLEGTTATLAGTVWGQRESPLDIAAMLVGPRDRPAQSLLRSALKQVLAGSGTQTFLEPGIQAQRQAVGLETGVGQAMQNIALSGLVGGALDLGVRGTVRGLRTITKTPPTVTLPDGTRVEQPMGGIFRDAPDIEEILRNPPAPVKPDGPTELPPDISPELIARIEAGDVEAFRELITARPEIAEDPAVRGALAEVEAGTYLPTKIDGVDDGEGLRTFSQMLRSDADPFEPRPRLPDDTPESRTQLDPARAAELLSDPQVAALIKAADDAQPGLGRVLEGLAEAGLPQVLDAVEDAVRRARAGEQQDAIAKAFADATLLLANEVGPERLQALAGIHSGAASPLEIASAFRSMPDLIDNSLPASPPVEIAKSLARLSDSAFEMVRRGEADPIMAQVVSDHAPDMAHSGLLDDLKKAGITDPDEARRAIADLLPPEREPDAMPLDGGSKIDDPAGAEAKAQTERLATEYATEIAEDQAKLEARKAQVQQMQEKAVQQAEQAQMGQRLKDAIDEAVAMSGGRIEVKTFASMGDLPAGMAEQVLRGNAEFMRSALAYYRTAATDEGKAAAVKAIETARKGQAVEAFYHDNAIWLAEYALNPQGRVAHEMVHALVATGQLTKAELAELAAYARRAELFDPMREATYRAAYEVDNPVSRVAEMLDEEAAAHLIEAYRNGKLPEPKAEEPSAPTGILARIQAFAQTLRESIMRAIGREPVKPDAEPIDSPPAIIDAILNGEVARRVVIAERLKQEDVSAVAVRPDAGVMMAMADLDMSPEARKARAEAMGFDTGTVYYHGTKYTFDAFEVSSDRTKTGSGEYGRADQGVFLTPDRNFAREYGKNVGSYYIRDPKPYIFQRSADLSVNDKARARQELQYAKDNGFSSFHDIREFAPEIIIFDPSNIRSINAAFDPANADSPNLMFAMADTAQPEQPNEVQRLTSRLRKLAPAASQIDPAFPERVQAGLELLTTMREVQSENIDPEAAPNVVSLAQENASRTLMQMMEVLGPERTQKVQADVQTLLQDLPNDPQELAARINGILDQYFPEEPKKAANDNMDLGPTSPVEQEMFNIERIGAIMELIGVCRG